jgi:integrase
MRRVGRTRTQTTLPKYVIKYHGAYYYRGPATQWKRLNLGRDFADAMTKFGSLYREAGLGTMADVFDKYEQTVVPSKADATQASNRFELGNLRKVFAKMRPTDVEPVDCYAFRDAIAAKHGVVQANNHLALLKHVFVKAIEWGATKTHPARDVRKIPVAPRTRLPQRHEVEMVRRHALPMIQHAMTLAELTSMDRAGVLALERKHCQEDGIHHVRPKTKRRAARAVIIEWSDELRAVVDAAKKLKPVFRQHIIATRSGKRFTPSGFSTAWQRAMVAAENEAKRDGVEFERFHFHDLRALSITETASLVEASERAGHSSTEITQRVYRRKPARVRPLR